jgi:hypothetical protein
MKKPKRKKPSRVSPVAAAHLALADHIKRIEKLERESAPAILASMMEEDARHIGKIEADIILINQTITDAVRKEVIAQRFAEFCEKPVPWYRRLFRKKPKSPRANTTIVTFKNSHQPERVFPLHDPDGTDSKVQ